MGQPLGLVVAAVQLGLQAIIVKPKRSIGPFEAHVTLREVHTDELEITDQPVEEGSLISDHSFRRPSELEIECLWSDSPPASNAITGLLGTVTGTVNGVNDILTGNSLDQIRDVYQKLLALQASRERFDVFTGKRAYKNMMIKSLVTETDRSTENTLKATFRLREIIIAQVSVVTIAAPPEEQADPQSTQPTIDRGLRQLLPDPRINMRAAVEALTPDILAPVLELVP